MSLECYITFHTIQSHLILPLPPLSSYPTSPYLALTHTHFQLCLVLSTHTIGTGNQTCTHTSKYVQHNVHYTSPNYTYHTSYITRYTTPHHTTHYTSLHYNTHYTTAGSIRSVPRVCGPFPHTSCYDAHKRVQIALQKTPHML
jgi:hypothetical protein